MGIKTYQDNCLEIMTGIVCKRLNREFIGIEADPNMYDVATKRLKEL